MASTIFDRVLNVKELGAAVRGLISSKRPKPVAPQVEQHKTAGGHHFGGPAIGAIALLIGGRDEAKAITEALPPSHSLAGAVLNLWNLPTERLAGVLALTVCFLGTIAALVLLIMGQVRRRQ